MRATLRIALVATITAALVVAHLIPAGPILTLTLVVGALVALVIAVALTEGASE